MSHLTTINHVDEALLVDGYEVIIGLEVHAELATKTKMFCGCQNQFGGEPNTNVCPVCLGLPGSMPVLNEQAVELAIRIGTALGCAVEPSVFSRKNYFYPDMPKNYQTSQYDLPINVGGHLKITEALTIGIERAHLEEDTGKNTHMGGGGRIHDAEYSLVDYNRSGVPLIEIVSRPDMRSSEQAKQYVSELRGILVTIGASDGKMEEGSMRVDANVSVHKPGEPWGKRCEIKNVNSLRSVGRAIDYEVARQIQLIENGEQVEQQTRHWNENEGRTSFGRSKEEAYDYRYFPEPDLVPVAPDAQWLENVKRNLPELPASRRDRLTDLAPDVASDAIVTVVDLNLDALVFSVIEKGGDPKTTINRVSNELAGNLEAAEKLDVDAFAKLISLETGGKLTATQAKQVLADMLAQSLEGKGTDPEAIAKSKGFEALDESALQTTVDEIVAAHPDELQRMKDGDQKLMGFFTGKVMAATKGKADGKIVAAMLRKHAQ
jgi:aspartyl-tRNA(Asn)/glutamyl-tRNA(Gln) amidotransferase subunit B